MITYDMIKDAQDTLIEHWGDEGKNVIVECSKVAPFNDTFDNFLNHCYSCGGNWGGMLLSGIKELYPDVWESIPDDMGCFAFTDICMVLNLCGVDTSEED